MTTVQKVTVGARGATNTTPMVAKGAIFPAREKGGGRRNGGTHQIGHTALLRGTLMVYQVGRSKWKRRAGCSKQAGQVGRDALALAHTAGGSAGGAALTGGTGALLIQSIQLRDMQHPDYLRQFSQTCELASTQNTQPGAFSLAVFIGNGKEQVCSV